jgi:hypothetical protein
MGTCPPLQHPHQPSPGSRPIVAYAHSVFATFCALSVPASASARPSSTLISPAPGSRPIVAYAHSVFATPCAVKGTIFFLRRGLRLSS